MHHSLITSVMFWKQIGDAASDNHKKVSIRDDPKPLSDLRLLVMFRVLDSSG